eukprot:gene10450-11545_t
MEIWRMKTGIDILHILHEIFDDVIIDRDFDASQEDQSIEDELEDEWLAVRDDSEIIAFNDTYEMQEADHASEELEQLV